MNLAERKAFTLGYLVGMRTMLLSINAAGPGDFKPGDNPERISNKTTNSQRLIDIKLRATGLD